MPVSRLPTAASLIHVLVAGIIFAGFLPESLQAPLQDGNQQYHVFLMETDSVGSPLSKSGSDTALGAGRRYFILDGFKERLILNLTTSSDLVLVSQNIVIEHHTEEGVNEDVEEFSAGCLHRGEVQRQDGGVIGWAAVTTCNGMSGLISVADGVYSIEPSHNGRSARGAAGSTEKRLHHLQLHNHPQSSHTSTESDKGSTCYTGGDTLSTGQQRRSRRHQHSVSQKTIEVAVVADKLMVDRHSRDQLLPYILTLMNVVSHLFNDPSVGDVIRLALVKVVILESYPAGFPTSSLAPHLRDGFCRWQQQGLAATQHDIALLLTRRSICEGGLSNCGILGITHIGGMCRSGKSCAVAKDTGLSTAFTIAHEMGHNLGLRHDGDQPNGCQSGYHIMAPSFSSTVNPHLWSQCSKRHLQSFLRSDASSCLNNEANATVAPPPSQAPLPGLMYTLEEQCQLLYGPSATHCNTTSRQDQCSKLWCSVPTSTVCVTQHSPPSPGSTCLLPNNTNGVCYHNTCQRYSVVTQPVHGQWSEWRQWSVCSLSCGVGVQHSIRECDSPRPAYGGAHCLGVRKRVRTCNTQACPDGSKSYRQQKCEQLRSSGRADEWEAVSDATIASFHLPACQLHCQKKGSQIVHTRSTNVSDGASCLTRGYKLPGVCVEGECVSVGCDNQLNSPGRFDQCGVWCGRNDTCVHVTETYSSNGATGSSPVYTDVVVIPKGSRNIRISLTAPSANRIAVRSVDSCILNCPGHVLPALSYTRRLFHGGEWWQYTYTSSSSESLAIKGPTSIDIIAQVIVTSSPVSLRYSHVSMISSYQSSTSAGLFSSWRVGNWSSCSAECGPGVSRRSVQCVSGDAVSKGLCVPTVKPVETRQCNGSVCDKYHWTVGNWTECDVTCGNGSQSRSVQCRHMTSHALVTDSYCDRLPVPARTRDCSMGPCSHWVYRSWSECSVSCGNGTMEQFSSCQTPAGVASTSCDPALQPPVLHKNCNNPACPSPTSCIDTQPTEICDLIARVMKLCSDSYFNTLCCHSCSALNRR